MSTGARGQKPAADERGESGSLKEMDIEEHMQKYLDQGMDKKEAMKQVAKDRGVSKRDIYQELLKK